MAALVRGEATTLSFAAFDGEEPIGHALFTLHPVGGEAEAGALLGPLAVRPDRQGAGLGSALVRNGMERLAARGVGHVFVLGDPAYYGRFGFRAERDARPPHDLPPEWEEAWQSLALDGAEPLPPGPLDLPRPWMDPALWRP